MIDNGLTPHIVADATLHLRKGGPLRLVGRIKWMIDHHTPGTW